jgi:hypothetical protein
MGKGAREALEGTHEWRAVDGPDIKRLKVGASNIPWIAMPHPTAFGQFHRCRKERLERYCQEAAAALVSPGRA